MSLSWEEGQSFAITEGEKEQEILRFREDNQKPGEKRPPSNVLEVLVEEGYFRGVAKKPKKTYEAIRDMVSKERGTIPADFEKVYHDADLFVKEKAGLIVRLQPPLTFSLLPNPDPEQREVVYIASASGSGKTYFACKYLRYYAELFPERQTYIFTADPHDKTILNSHLPNCTIVDVDKEDPETKENEFLARDIKVLKDLRDCCILIDDLDYMPNKKVIEKLKELLKDLLGVGRHSNVSVLVTNQIITDYNKTRNIINQAHWVVFFPKSSIGKNSEYFLNAYLKIKDPEVVGKIMTLGRWVAIRPKYPNVMLYETGAEILNVY